MQHTASYGLSQWDSDDRILRTDFNSDNAKIDAALAALPYRKLKEITTTASAQQVDIDLSDLDITAYHKLEFYFTFPSETCSSIAVRINGVSSNYFQENHNTSDSSALATIVANTPAYAGASCMIWRIGSGILCETISGRSGSNLYDSLMGYSIAAHGAPTTLNLLGDTIKAGSNLSIYGVRA